ncbi:hypothetical protein C2869_12005 [Saccharobesus litoralis]|uniref:Uncharacterized protein n=1 Tax=Saccharobesus litoralis TaxID=2172099 RepID=A0A2S0VSB4_9ALTE|nr:hypothetical protein [Saccharobesus litoralis]AWB67111.1 hypothetical protein C2869_12005 [Saccharobesus litoralis]
MTQLIKIVITSLALLFCLPAWATFTIPGKATITYPSGVKKTVDFNFEFKAIDGQTHFIAGPFKMATSSAPEKYSIAVLLHHVANKNKDYAWVQEFGQGYFKEFSYKLGDHQIDLVKVPNRKVKGQYEFRVDGKTYLFDAKTVQIVLHFSDTGISHIELDGAIKDLAIGR